MTVTRIHCLADAQNILVEGSRGVIVLSPPFAPRSLGIGFWREILNAAKPGVTAILDCGDHAGDVMAAIHVKIPHILYSGDAKTLEKLRQLAKLANVKLYANIKEVQL